MVVDVTLSRGNGVSGPSRLSKLDAHQRAVESLVEALKPWRNWYLDLGNERNIQDKRFTSFDDLKQLRTRVREVDPHLLVTASHGGDLTDDDLRKYVITVGVDFVTPHRPRQPKSPGQTEEVTRKLLRAMNDLGRVVPVHYQEPIRRAYGLSLDVQDFETDLRGALAGGAAGWCFHNGDTRHAKDGRPRRSFDLTSQRLFVQLDDIEQKTVRNLKGVAGATDRKTGLAEPLVRRPLASAASGCFRRRRPGGHCVSPDAIRRKRRGAGIAAWPLVRPRRLSWHRGAVVEQVADGAVVVHGDVQVGAGDADVGVAGGVADFG
jgi:hypothetical protein